jgi:UDP-N-acetylmuramyl tripeptide synthase
MDKIRFFIALWGAKLTQLLLRLLGRKATYFSGKLALKVCPDFLSSCGRPEILIGVTGTNGKTTVSNLISDVLEGWGEDILNNRYGSNIDAGIATSLINAAGMNGRCKKHIGVLEMDERSAEKILPCLKPDWLLITNLFRDSMRRNAHPEYIASLLEKNIPSKTRLILNADDLISANVSPLNTRAYFGIDPLSFEPPVRDNIVIDVRTCPVCGSKLEYSFRRYNHIGSVTCPSCGLKSPEPDYRLVSADMENQTMTVLEKDGWYDYAFDASAVYNIYNYLSVSALLREMGYEKAKIAEAFRKLKIVQSRFWKEEINGKELTEIMAKGLNAVACSRSFDFVSNQEGKKSVVLMLDDVFDEKESSENIAWLYDADFEFLNSPDIIQVVSVGVRCLDSRLRLLIAGVEAEKIKVVPDAKDAAAAVDIINSDKIYVLYELYRHSSAVSVRNEIAERLRR